MHQRVELLSQISGYLSSNVFLPPIPAAGEATVFDNFGSIFFFLRLDLKEGEKKRFERR